MKVDTEKRSFFAVSITAKDAEELMINAARKELANRSVDTTIPASITTDPYGGYIVRLAVKEGL